MVENRRLLIVLGSMGRGGAERVISHISNYFASKGWKVYIALLLFNKVDYDLNPNIEVINLSGNTSSRIKRFPYWIKSLRKTVKSIKPNAILSFAARISIVVQLSCLGIPVDITVSERNDPYMDGRSKLIDILTRFLYPKAKAVVFQTKRAEGYFDKINLTNSIIIPNPISINCEKGDHTLKKIVTVGRLTKQKNQEMLIRAFAEVWEKYPEYSLWIYGDGELRVELEQLVKEFRIEKNVVFGGNVEDVHSRIADAEMFVLPSNYEGLSNALLEAMMMGLPCISTRCAGSDEYIVNKENGILVEIDDKNEMKEAILSYIENREFMERCGDNAKEVYQRVSKEVVLQKWYMLIADCKINLNM